MALSVEECSRKANLDLNQGHAGDLGMSTIEHSVRQELLSASDEMIDDAVKYADPMVLRGLLFQLTGDKEVEQTEVALTMQGGLLPLPVPAPKTPEVANFLRRKAAEFLKSYRDAGAGPMGPGPKE